FGSAVAAVAAVDGATYSWSVDGGSILSGAGTERILIAIEGGNALRVTAAIAKDGCTTTAAGVMALHDAFTIKTLDAGSGDAGQRRGGVGDDHAERRGGGQHQRHRDHERRLRRLRHGARRRQPGL